MNKQQLILQKLLDRQSIFHSLYELSFGDVEQFVILRIRRLMKSFI